MSTFRRRDALAAVFAMAFGLRLAGAAQAAPVQIVMRTEAGPILIELYPDAAPITVANFLAYVDKGLLTGAAFYRTVGPANDHNPAKINVVQGGRDAAPGGLPPIAHETTEVTRLRHIDGVISMARDAPGSATSEFFICLGANPALDFGGARNPDGQGFAAFGRVVSGMKAVRKIHAAPTRAAAGDPYLVGQLIAAPVKILGVERRWGGVAVTVEPRGPNIFNSLGCQTGLPTP